MPAITYILTKGKRAIILSGIMKRNAERLNMKSVHNNSTKMELEDIVCSRCTKPIMDGSQVVSKRSGRSGRWGGNSLSRFYHYDCARAVNVI